MTSQTKNVTLTPFGLKVDTINETPITDNLHKPRLRVTGHDYWGETFLLVVDPTLLDINRTTLRVERINGENRKILVQLPKVNSNGDDQIFVELRNLTEWKHGNG